MAETLPISRNRDVVILTRMVPRLIIQVLVSRFQVLPRAPLAQPDGFINGVLLSSIAVSLKHFCSFIAFSSSVLISIDQKITSTVQWSSLKLSPKSFLTSVL